MNYTQHANDRSNQRGFRKEEMLLIEMFGEEFYAKGGAVKLRIPIKKRALIRKELEKRIIALSFKLSGDNSKELKQLRGLKKALDSIIKKEFVVEPNLDLVITMQIIKKKSY